MSATAVQDGAPRSEQEVQAILADTAKAVKVMKASWLRVAINLKRIREHELWRHVTPRCENFEDYIFGVLQLNKYVARRMLQAMDFTEERRPDIIERFAREGEEMDIPSYDTVNQLRRAERELKERPDDFAALESKVFEEGVGRVTLKKELDGLLDRDDDVRDGGSGGGGSAPPEVAVADEPPSLERVIDRLKDIERELLRLEVSKEARKLIFRLVETLEKER